MNHSVEGYKAMLTTFKVHDLRTLLATFGCNNNGLKYELQAQAFDILRNKPSGFNYNAYLQKIYEMYSLIHGLSQSRLQIRSGAQNEQGSSITKNNSLQRGQHHTAPRVKTVSANKKLKIVESQSVKPGTSSTNNTVGPSSEILAKVKFIKLPFYPQKSEIIRPLSLFGRNKPTNISKIMREQVFKINLSTEDLNHITLNRDTSYGKCMYLYEILIRIGQLEETCTELNDFLPHHLHIVINGTMCPLPPFETKKSSNMTPRRNPRPIECTTLLKLNPDVQNTIAVNWFPDGKFYMLTLILVNKLSSQILLEKLLEKRGISVKETKNYIIKNLADKDPDLATTSHRFSLLCPLSKVRMRLPAKSIKCKHLQCFDASTFLLMNEKKSTWTCPTCNLPCLYDDLQIMLYFLDIIESPILPDSCTEIEILSNGMWKVYGKTDTTNMASSHNKENEIDTVIIDNSDDEMLYVSQESFPNSKIVNSDVVDLTLSDYGETSENDDFKEADLVYSVTTTD